MINFARRTKQFVQQSQQQQQQQQSQQSSPSGVSSSASSGASSGSGRSPHGHHGTTNGSHAVAGPSRSHAPLTPRSVQASPHVNANGYSTSSTDSSLVSSSSNSIASSSGSGARRNLNSNEKAHPSTKPSSTSTSTSASPADFIPRADERHTAASTSTSASNSASPSAPSSTSPQQQQQPTRRRRRPPRDDGTTTGADANANATASLSTSSSSSSISASNRRPRRRARTSSTALATATASTASNVKVVPRHVDDADPNDIVVLVADMLTRLMTHNDTLPLDPSSLTRFHSRATPGISIQSYLHRIAKYTSLEKACTLILLVYIDRVCEQMKGFTICGLTVHRFVCAALVCASKALCDAFSTNGHYARVGGISLVELNLLEKEFLNIIDWRLTCSGALLQHYYVSLVASHPSYTLDEGDDDEDDHDSGEEDGEEQDPDDGDEEMDEERNEERNAARQQVATAASTLALQPTTE